MLRTRVTLITLLHSPDSCLCHGIASASFKITGCLRSRFISLVSSPRSRPIVRESVLSVCRAMTLPFNPFIDRWRASVCRAFKNSLEITRERGPVVTPSEDLHFIYPSSREIYPRHIVPGFPTNLTFLPGLLRGRQRFFIATGYRCSTNKKRGKG